MSSLGQPVVHAPVESIAPAPERDRRIVAARRPAVPVALSLAAGIVADRALSIAWHYWLWGAVAALSGWSICYRRRWQGRAAACLLVAWACAGGARHHQVWSVRLPDDAACFATHVPQPARLRGRISSRPWVEMRLYDPLRAAWPQIDRTHCLVQCRSLDTGQRVQPVSGCVRLTVEGHLLHVAAGDEVEIVGMMSRPRGPANPGQFDFRDFLRRFRCGCVMYAETPEAVIQLRAAPQWSLGRLAHRMRASAESTLRRNLSGNTVGLASALLLGDRSELEDDVRTAFAESGMMHLLAVSGLHVGILAGLLWLVCRIANLSPGPAAVVMLAGILFYGLIVELRPPIARAAVFLFVVVCGRPWYRQSSVGNTLGIAAVAALLWNPSDLFDAGAQLSFLSVAAIAWSLGLRKGRSEMPPLPDPMSRSGRRLAALTAWLKDGYRLVFAIWLFTVPLVAARFQLISPVGFVLNVFLVPAALLVLWCGYIMLFLSFWLPELAPLPACLFDLGLKGLLGVVTAAANWKLGHAYVPPPPAWWLGGYYVLLVVGIAWAPPIGGGRCWGWAGWCAWLVLGLGLGLAPARPAVLRCTFLSVGHGLAILLELPEGRTLLYDAGSIDDGRRAAGLIRSTMAERGIWRLDAIVISHADIDHFNAVPDLLRAVPVGTVLVAPSFLDFQQPSVVQVCESAVQAGVPVQIVVRGDRLRLDPAVGLNVLHPARGAAGLKDNANSVVLEVEYAGRKVLLTGDLEGEGLQALMESGPGDVDVLLAPHHGAAAANSSRLADWAAPQYVIPSCGFNVDLPLLRQRYGPQAHVLPTSFCGAVTVTVTPAGALHCQTFRNELP